MLKILRLLFVAAVLALVLPLLAPQLRLIAYTVQLASRDVPERFEVPVAGVRRTALRDSWHAPRSGGRRHEGIDIFAPRGTPVRASTEGVVTRIGHSRLGGHVVWVIGPGGQRHYYAHLDRFGDIHRGQRIAAGAILGYVGNTGNARHTPPHLHYGVYAGGGAINPFPLLRSAAPQGEEGAG